MGIELMKNIIIFKQSGNHVNEAYIKTGVVSPSMINLSHFSNHTFTVIWIRVIYALKLNQKYTCIKPLYN